MNRDTGDRVESEEERSIESVDLLRDDISDLIDETEEIRRRPAEPENPDVLSTNTASVPILNNSGRSQAGGQDNPDVELEEETTDQRGGIERGPPAGGWTGRRPPLLGKRFVPQGETLRPFLRRDIDSSEEGTTLTGSLPLDYPLGRGYETRVEGYAGASHESPGRAITQRLLRTHHSKPLPIDQEDEKEDATLKRPESGGLPSEPDQKEEGVEFTWVDPPQEVDPEELLLAENEQREEEELEREERELQADLEVLLAKADDVSRQRSNFLDKKEGTRLAEERGMLMQAVISEGTWVPLIVENQEHLRRVDLREIDVATCVMKEQWGRGWRFCREVETRAKMEVRETAFIMEDTSGLLDRLYPELVKVVDQRELEETIGRHRLLATGLAGPAVSPQVSMLFPREDAQAILDWYVRLRVGLKEVERLKQTLGNATGAVGELMRRYPGPKHKSPLTLARTAGAGSAKGSDKGTLGLESYRSDFRLQAKTAGKGYRMEAGGSPGPLGDDINSHERREPKDLPSHLIRSRGRAKEPEVEEVYTRTGGSERSRVSEYDEDSGISGFEGESMETIVEELHVYVCDSLSELGKDTPVTEAIIMDCVPMLNLWTKNQSSTTKEFVRAVKDIKPRTVDDYISVREWWKAINLLADDYGWSLRMRVTFMRRTGGLPPKHNDNIVRRMKDLMDHMSEWIRSSDSFETNKPESDQRYWLYAWTDVGLKMIAEFHQIQQVDEIERQLGELMEEEAYQIKANVDDPLNSQFHKVQSLYKAMNNWLRDRSSALVESPLYVWKLLTEWMKASKPMGPLMLTHINKALNKLGSNVEDAIPRGHGRTKAQLEIIRKKGAMGATESTYGLILERLKLMAVNKELTMEVKTFSEMRDLQDQAGESESSGTSTLGKKKKGVGKVNSVTTDYYRPSSSVSSMTLNTSTSAGRGERFPLCQTCRLFHNTDKKGKDGKPVCLFWDPVARSFKIKAFLAHRNVVVMTRKGDKSLSEYWQKKLDQYAFPAMGISTTKDKNKIFHDLRDAVAAQPKATNAEIKQYAEESKRFVAMVEREDKQNINALRREVSALVSLAVSITDKAASRKVQRQKKSSSKASKEAESESSSESEDESGEESDFSN